MDIRTVNGLFEGSLEVGDYFKRHPKNGTPRIRSLDDTVWKCVALGITSNNGIVLAESVFDTKEKNYAILGCPVKFYDFEVVEKPKGAVR